MLQLLTANACPTLIHIAFCMTRPVITGVVAASTSLLGEGLAD